MKKYCFDLDNTLCVTKNGEYEKSYPIVEAIRAVNNLYIRKNIIIIFTARMMGRCNGDLSLVYESIYQLTKKQLKDWNVCYHKLILGKPEYDVLIDDKSINFDENWFTKYL